MSGTLGELGVVGSQWMGRMGALRLPPGGLRLGGLRGTAGFVAFVLVTGVALSARAEEPEGTKPGPDGGAASSGSEAPGEVPPRGEETEEVLRGRLEGLRAREASSPELGPRIENAKRALEQAVTRRRAGDREGALRALGLVEGNLLVIEARARRAKLAGFVRAARARVAAAERRHRDADEAVRRMGTAAPAAPRAEPKAP